MQAGLARGGKNRLCLGFALALLTQMCLEGLLSCAVWQVVPVLFGSWNCVKKDLCLYMMQHWIWAICLECPLLRLGVASSKLRAVGEDLTLQNHVQHGEWQLPFWGVWRELGHSSLLITSCTLEVLQDIS